MTHHIKPTSISQYLSGIISSLEPHFPNVREICNRLLISRTLAGMRKLRGFTGMSRKHALDEEDLITILNKFPICSLDDLVMIAIVFTGFHALLRLGEMTQPDNVEKRTFRKMSLRHSLVILASFYSFILPSHKADCFFEGRMVWIEGHQHSCCPLHPFLKYIAV